MGIALVIKALKIYLPLCVKVSNRPLFCFQLNTVFNFYLTLAAVY